LSWLIEKFWPVKGWTEDDLKKLKANTFRFVGQNHTAKTEEVEPVESQSQIKPAERKHRSFKKITAQGIIYLASANKYAGTANIK
jgi:hypothetical protein